jgi:hypothetical protein
MPRRPATPAPPGADVPQALVQHVLTTLEPFGLAARLGPKTKTSDNTGHDFTIQLGKGGDKQIYCVTVKRGLRPATLGPLILSLHETNALTLLIADHITPAMAKALLAANIPFIDLAGNLWINHRSHTLYIEGRKPAPVPHQQKPMRAFQNVGLRVVFALLCEPNWAALPTRELATKLGVANGTIGWVLQDLKNEGYLHVLGRRDRYLARRRELLDRWTTAYPGQLRNKLLKGRFRAPQREWWKTANFSNEAIVLGAEPAGDRLTEFLKPGVVTLYTRGAPRHLNELLLQNQIVRDPEGDMEVLEAFWPDDIPTDQPGLAPTPLIYADLLATGNDRCLQTAKMIYDRYLAERFRED